MIVGAGVAGLALATALGREGLQVAVIDGAPRPDRPLKVGRSLTGISG